MPNDPRELLPCPFCKSPETFVYECEDASAGCSTFWIECESCGARGSISEYKDGAVLYWNSCSALRSESAVREALAGDETVTISKAAFDEVRDLLKTLVLDRRKYGAISTRALAVRWHVQAATTPASAPMREAREALLDMLVPS